MCSRSSIALILALLAASGCGSTDPAPPSTEVAAAAPQDWVTEVASNPAPFGALLEAGGRGGWVALHSGDPKGALAQFTADGGAALAGRARAADALAHLYLQLTALDADVRERRRAQLQTRGAAPTAAQEADHSAFLACQAGRFQEAAGWVGERAPLHLGPPEPLAEAAATLMRTEAEEAFNRQFYDPCALPALAAAWRARATEWEQAANAASPPAPPLSWTLFSAWPTAADRAAARAAGPEAWPSAATLKVQALAPDAGVQAARDQVQALDTVLDAQRVILLNRASEDGRSLLNDLGLTARLRQGVLSARADAALANQQRAAALVFAESAVDVTERAVGARNAPEAWATLARAQLANGHTREALDALHVLVGPFPELVGARERLADLVVAEGLGRAGDSKEH